MLQKEKYRKVRKKAGNVSGRQGVVQPKVQELKASSKDPSPQPAWVPIPAPALLTEFCTPAAHPTPPSSHSHQNKDFLSHSGLWPHGMGGETEQLQHPDTGANVCHASTQETKGGGPQI